MMQPCPECGGELTDLNVAAAMSSGSRRYDCHECALAFVADAAGMLTEIDDS